MATVEIAFLSPATGEIDSAYPSSVEVMTSSASNQVSAGSAGPAEVCVVTCSGGNVYLAFGVTPDATVTSKRRLVLDGQTRTFQVNAGHKAAVVDA